jgi:hypothetical protein
MGFDLSSDLMPFDAGRKTIHENRTVRIPERQSGYGVDLLIDGKGIIDDLVMSRTVIKRNILGSQAGKTHSDPYVKKIFFTLEKFGISVSGCGEENDLGGIDFFLVIKVSGCASQSVSRNFGLGPVCVEYAEFDVSLRFIFDRDEEQAIGSDSSVAVTDSSCENTDVRKVFSLSFIDNQEIVS